jgi:hypothetical protein
MALIARKAINGIGLTEKIVKDIVNMSLKIYLLRHGETEYSQRGAYCGALDPELTPEGSQMAEAFAAAGSFGGPQSYE